jgi:hypothetical protein
VQRGDYNVPVKDANLLIDYDLRHNPDLFFSTRRGRTTPAASKRSSTTGAF